MSQEPTREIDQFGQAVSSNARFRLRSYIEKNYGADGRRRFLKELRARLLLHGQMLEQQLGRVDFSTLKEKIGVRDLQPQQRTTIADRDCADRLRGLISLSVNKAFRPLRSQHATMIELLFDMPEGYLSKLPDKKMPAYVMLQCMGQTALALMTQIQHHPIVDEVALLVGDADLYIRIFGTSEQLQQFLLVDLYRAADLVASQAEGDTRISMDSIIRSTKTYTSFQDTYYLRYHPSRHPDFKLSGTSASAAQRTAEPKPAATVQEMAGIDLS